MKKNAEILRTTVVFLFLVIFEVLIYFFPDPPTSPSHPTPVAKEEQQSRDLERFRREEKERIKREKKEQLSEDIERFRLADREREENEKNNNVKKYY